MKEPKSKKFVLTALIASILFTVITLVSVAYLAGRDVSNQDTSAAVEEDTDWSINHYFELFQRTDEQIGNITLSTQKYASGGDSVGFMLIYYPPITATRELPSWDVEICGQSFKRTSASSFGEIVVMPRGDCTITATIFKGTAQEEGFTTPYNPIPRTTSKAMRTFPYAKTVPVDGSITIEKDLTRELTGINVDSVNWTMQSGDKCVVYPDYNTYYSNSKVFKYQVVGLETGKCRIVMTATAYSCYNCSISQRKAYRFRKGFDLTVTAPTGASSTPTPAL